MCNYFDSLVSIRRLIALACLLGAASANAQDARTAIGVNFIGGITPNPATSVTMAAGVVPQTNWNNLAPADPGEVEDAFDFVGTSSGTTLFDNRGQATPLVVAWQAEETYRVGISPIENGDQQLMEGYIDVDDVHPRSTVTVTGIPYPSYDLIVYVATDGNGRRASVDLDNSRAGDTIEPALTKIWFETNVGGDQFKGPEDYIQATATTEAAAFPSNFLLYTGLSSADLQISVNRGVSGGNPNAGIAGFQLVDRSNLLLLRVDTRTGNAYLTVRNDVPVPLNGYQLTSTNNTLRPDNWTTFGSRGLDIVDTSADADTIPGSSPGEGWEVLQGTGDSMMESFLFGSTPIDRTVSISLGQIYDAAFGADESLTFEYSLLAPGPVLQGLIEFFESSIPGDFNRDTVVNGLDYDLWRSSFGARGVGLPADGNFDNRVDAADYTIWRDHVGGSASVVANPVPEPSCLVLALLMAGAVNLRLRARR